VTSNADPAHAKNQVTVAVVSASAAMLDVLTRVLSRNSAFRTAGAFPDSASAREALRRNPVDVVLGSRPPASPEEVVVWRSFHDAGIASLLLAPNPRPQDALWSVIAGASGFAPGPIAPRTITDTLLRIAGGNTALPADVIGQLTDMPGARWRLNLDESERRLLSAVMARQTTQQMALQLQLSPEDVFAGLVGICEKVPR